MFLYANPFPFLQALASEFLRNPAKVVVGTAELTANHNVTQVVEVMEPDARERRLLELLKQYHASRTNRVLIFVLYKKEAVYMERMLQQRGWNARAIHGDKTQVRSDVLFLDSFLFRFLFSTSE